VGDDNLLQNVTVEEEAPVEEQK
jgi:hypothetical protein